MESNGSPHESDEALSPSTSAKKRTTFFDLPAELRNTIYELITHEHHDFGFLKTDSRDHRFTIQPAHINRQLRREYIPAYFNYAALWICSQSLSSEEWLNTFGKDCIPFISRFLIRETGHIKTHEFFDRPGFALYLRLKGTRLSPRLEIRGVTESVEVEVVDLHSGKMESVAEEVRGFVEDMLRRKANGRLDLGELKEVRDFTSTLWGWSKAIEKLEISE